MRHVTHTSAKSAFLAASAVLLSHAQATAADHGSRTVANACQFREHAKELLLLGDCTTDASIVIPDGFTLDGQHHRITALDPTGGSFQGAVITNGGEEAHVRNVVLRASELGPRCSVQRGAELAAIALVDCSGSVVDTQIEAVYRRGFACDEGTGIAVRAEHEHAFAAQPRSIVITGNHVEHFGAAGVSVMGPISADIQLNHINGARGREHAQYGVRLGAGATGSVRWNDVRSLSQGRVGRPSAGLYVSETPGPVDISLNRLEQTDVGVALVGAGGVMVESNLLARLGRAAVEVDGRRRPSTDNQIRNNRTSDAPTAVLFTGPGSRANTLSAGPNERVESDVREVDGAGDNSVEDAR